MNCFCSGQNNEHLSTEKLEASDNETRDCQFTMQDKSSKKNLTINQLLNWQHYKQPIPLDVMQVINCSNINKTKKSDKTLESYKMFIYINLLDRTSC